MAGLDYQIQLTNDYNISIAQHLITPLLQEKSLVNPYTNYDFSIDDRGIIKRFCTNLRFQLKAVLSNISVETPSDLINEVDNNFEMTLSTGTVLSLQHILTHYIDENNNIKENSNFSHEDLIEIKKLCWKGLKTLSIIKWTLTPIRFCTDSGDMVPINCSIKLKDILAYYTLKKIFKLFGKMGHMDFAVAQEDLSLKTIDNEAPFQFEDIQNSLNVATLYLKNAEQFSILNISKRLSPSNEIDKTLAIIDNLLEFIKILVENSYFDQAIALGHRLSKKLDGILSLKTKAKPAVLRHNKKTISFLETVHAWTLKEIAYSYFRQNDLLSATSYSKLALDLANATDKGQIKQNASIHGSLHQAIIAIYQIQIGNIEIAEPLIEKLLKLLAFDKDQMVYHADIIALAIEQLANHYVYSQNYESALALYEHQLKLIPKINQLVNTSNSLSAEKQAIIVVKCSPIGTIENRISMIKNKIQAQHNNVLLKWFTDNSATALMQNAVYDPVKLTICVTMPDQQASNNIKTILEKNNVQVAISSEENVLILSNLSEITPNMLKQVESRAKTVLLQKKQTRELDLAKATTAQNPPPPAMNDLSTAPATLVPVSKATTPRIRAEKTNKSKPAQPKREKQTTPSISPVIAASVPSNITWEDKNIAITYEPANPRSTNKVYPISMERNLFAYLDTAALLNKIDSNTLKSTQDILKIGSLAIWGQGVRKLRKTEMDPQSPYKYKIRLLGKKDARGDIRIYGRPVTATVNNKTLTLIIFDYVNLHAHQSQRRDLLPKASWGYRNRL